MQNIILAFKPWLDADPYLDICRSDKFGWVCIDRMSVDNVEVFCQFPEDSQQLLTVLSVWFYDRAAGETAREAADNALDAMRPYLRQLPQHLAEVARITLEVYAKVDDTAP